MVSRKSGFISTYAEDSSDGKRREESNTDTTSLLPKHENGLRTPTRSGTGEPFEGPNIWNIKLGPAIGKARILTYGYQAGSGHDESGVDTLENISNEFLRDIYISPGNVSTRGPVFVAQDLGGIIVKQVSISYHAYP